MCTTIPKSRDSCPKRVDFDTVCSSDPRSPQGSDRQKEGFGSDYGSFLGVKENNRSIIQVTNITEWRIGAIKPNNITQKGDANMNDTQRRLVELIQSMTEEQAAFVLTYLADAAEAQEQLPSS